MVTVQLGASAFQFDLYTVLVWALIGLIAGFLASRVTLGHGMGALGDVLVGILGALLGGILAHYFNVRLTIAGHPFLSEILMAFLGAVVLLMILRLTRFRGGRYVAL